MNVIFLKTAWEEYVEWQTPQNKKTISKINDLIKSIDRDGFNKGMGKPEALIGRKAWSRRINDEHRLVYAVTPDKDLLIFSCKGHYED